MRIIFELNHPKHYYQFKYVIRTLKDNGAEIFVLARDKDVLLNVLKEEQVPYEIFGVHKNNIIGKLFSSGSIFHNYRKIVKRINPDIIISKASLYGTLTAKISGIKSIIFPDSEVVALTNKIVAPLASMIITPEPFALDYGKKHHRIKGIFEDCYLSPSILNIDASVPAKLGLETPYAILRFVGWSANHDINNNGFTDDQKSTLAEALSLHLKVYISSEKPMPENLQKYKLSIPKAKIHDVLAGATLYVGDSQTMATEAALLGTPAIRSNSFVGDNDMSNFIMLENKYQLLYNVKDFERVMDLALDMSENSKKEEWKQKRASYYQNVGNPNAEIADLIETAYRSNNK